MHHIVLALSTKGTAPGANLQPTKIHSVSKALTPQAAVAEKASQPLLSRQGHERQSLNQHPPTRKYNPTFGKAKKSSSPKEPTKRYSHDRHSTTLHHHHHRNHVRQSRQPPCPVEAAQHATATTLATCHHHRNHARPTQRCGRQSQPIVGPASYNAAPRAKLRRGIHWIVTWAKSWKSEIMVLDPNGGRADQ